MPLRGRCFSVALAAVLSALAACGGDGTGPRAGPSAASVTGIAGDSQSATTGAILTLPLRFVALNGDGQPAPGVHVTWSASPGGAAAFFPADTTTDSTGSVSTSVRTGSIVGTITLTAQVTGVPNVVYHATVIDPCIYLAPFALGDSVNGALTVADCAAAISPVEAYFYDFYSLTVPTGQQSIRIDMRAGANDTYLVLWSAVSPFPFIAFNDDSIPNFEGARNSQLDIILPAADYIIGASAFAPNDFFAYSLTATTRPVSMNGCRDVWVMSGVTVSDDISAQDCSDSSATPHYYDVARIFVDAGTTLSVSEQSTALNPALALYKVVDTLPSDTTRHTYVREFVTSNDDSSDTNTNAFVQLTVDTPNYYDVIISTSSGGETGAYTLVVNASAAPSAPVPAARVREWWRVRPGDLLQRSRTIRGKKL